MFKTSDFPYWNEYDPESASFNTYKELTLDEHWAIKKYFPPIPDDEDKTFQQKIAFTHKETSRTVFVVYLVTDYIAGRNGLKNSWPHIVSRDQDLIEPFYKWVTQTVGLAKQILVVDNKDYLEIF